MILRLLDRRLGPDPKDFVTSGLKVLMELVTDIGLPNWVFDLVLVEDKTMANLNGQFRDKDDVTDVLSFSYLLENGLGKCDLEAGNFGAKTDLWVDPLAKSLIGNGKIEIGEVVLAPSFIKSRCLEKGWSVESQIPLLVVHGSLHLMGWDHQNKEEARAMKELEKTYLTGCGLPHPLQNEERLD